MYHIYSKVRLFQPVEEVEILEEPLDENAHSAENVFVVEPNASEAENRCSIDSKRKSSTASDVIFKIIIFFSQ